MILKSNIITAGKFKTLKNMEYHHKVCALQLPTDLECHFKVSALLALTEVVPQSQWNLVAL